MKDKVTLNEFCKKHPGLAKEVRALAECGSVTPDESGRFSESLLETAATVRANGGIKSGRYTATLK